MRRPPSTSRTIAECYRILGLPDSADAGRVTAAFRRLAKRYHPDVNRSWAARRHFVEIADAYRTLREHLRIESAGDAGPARGCCPRCRRFADLFDALDGGQGCAECLLGRSLLRRFLPLPEVVTARHVSVFVLYAAGFLHLGLYLSTGRTAYAASSLICIATGLLVLAGEVLFVAWLDRRIEPSAARSV